jgi:hypothetical protein
VILLAAADDGVSAGYIGLLIVLLLGVATVLLIRNMNARLKRLPRSFDEVSPPEDEPDDPASGPSAGA